MIQSAFVKAPKVLLGISPCLLCTCLCFRVCACVRCQENVRTLSGACLGGLPLRSAFVQMSAILSQAAGTMPQQHVVKKNFGISPEHFPEACVEWLKSTCGYGKQGRSRRGSQGLAPAPGRFNTQRNKTRCQAVASSLTRQKSVCRTCAQVWRNTRDPAAETGEFCLALNPTDAERKSCNHQAITLHQQNNAKQLSLTSTR